MFSFFRRSKKEPEAVSTNNNNNNNKESKELKAFRESNYTKDEVVLAAPTQIMCKNKTENVEIAPQGGNLIPKVLPEFALCESTSVPCNEVTLQNETTKLTNDNSPALQDTMNNKKTVPSYAALFKKSEPDTKSRNVKPCGHGTTAIAPRVPISAIKRNSIVSPPQSPVLEKSNCFAKSKIAADTNDSISAATLRQNERKGSLKESANDKAKPRKLSAPPAPTNPTITNGVNTRLEACASVQDDDAEKKNLINQEAKFQSQLNDLSKQLSQRDAEANKLRFQMEELQRDVFAKSAGMDRFQAELQAAQKESEYLRQRLRHLEDNVQDFRQKNSDLSEELAGRTENDARSESEAKAKINELEGVIKELRHKIESLESQIDELKQEKERLEMQHVALVAERENEKKMVEAALDEAIHEKILIDKKWEVEFEKLRTVNIMKEQQLLDDFEWKLREVEKSCKNRLQEKDRSINDKLIEAYQDAEEKMKIAQEMMDEVEHLKTCVTEVAELKDKTNNQQKSLELLTDQQEQMQQVEQSLKDEAKKLRRLIDLEKENLQHMQRMHHQEIVDKERWLHNTLEEKKTEIAVYWEEKLLHEIGRLKYELEQMHVEERQATLEMTRRQKQEEFDDAKKIWERKIEECLNEISSLKNALDEKDINFHQEMVSQQSSTDQDILELRRLMDKIDNAHHERFEKLVTEHEKEIDKINEDNENRTKEIEMSWQNQVISLKETLELVKDQMEKESQQKIKTLIQQHRSELDKQWANLLHQKSETVKLIEDEYVSKYKTLEEQFYTQQKSHEGREVELLKTIDSMKNDVDTKGSMIDDLQNNVDTLEGGVQVLNQEIAHQGEQLIKNRRDADQKIRGLQDVLIKLQALQHQEREEFQSKLNQQQKQSQTSMDHLQRKCTTLTKLFEEVRSRYEKREARQEDMNIISDLKQIIAEQEKDMACINEEKRYYQMKLMSMQRQYENNDDEDEDDEELSELSEQKDSRNTNNDSASFQLPQNLFMPQYNNLAPMNMSSSISIPPTILECDDCDEE